MYQGDPDRLKQVLDINTLFASQNYVTCPPASFPTSRPNSATTVDSALFHTSAFQSHDYQFIWFWCVVFSSFLGLIRLVANKIAHPNLKEWRMFLLIGEISTYSLKHQEDMIL